ncbi:hypothetical protein Tco_0104829 [Tanacetum coccineum]
MATTKLPASTAADKGKMTTYEPELVLLNDIKHKMIEARVYRKCTARNITTREPSHFCCILLDKQGNAIQANMDLKDTYYFDQLLQLNNAYRISRFIAYNEVEQRADVNGAPLTDYIGCIHQISDPIVTGDATRSRKTRRIIDIQNLDGVNLPFIIWNEEAEKFDIQTYAKLPKPVVIAVSSTWAIRKYGDFVNPTDALEIQRQRYSDDLQEQMRNRYCFRDIIDDGTGTATLTCFSPEAHTFVPECNAIVTSLQDQSSYEIPAILKEAENKTYVFQYRFGTKARPGYPAFVLDAVFKATPQPLLSLPAPPFWPQFTSSTKSASVHPPFASGSKFSNTKLQPHQLQVSLTPA